MNKIDIEDGIATGDVDPEDALVDNLPDEKDGDDSVLANAQKGE